MESDKTLDGERPFTSQSASSVTSFARKLIINPWKRFVNHNPHPELGSYIYCPKIVYDWSSVLLAAPIYIRYDEQTKLYVVQNCNLLQRMSCVFVTCCVAISVFSRLRFVGNVVLQDTGYIVAYFDFINEFVLNMFIFGNLYISWFRQDLVGAYIEVLQTTPLLTHCETPVWKTKLVGTLFSFLSFYLPTVWFFVVFGYDFTSFEEMLRTSQINAREVFWHDRNAPVEPTRILCVIAAIARYFNVFFQHMTLNSYSHIGHYCAYFVVDDFFGSLNRKNMAPDEVLALLEDFKILMKKSNEYLCLYTIVFTTMTLTYHSVHLFDCLNATTSIWKIQGYIYIGYVISHYIIPLSLFVKVKQLRKWLRKNDNCIKIPHLDLNSILYDLLDFRYGIRGGRSFTMKGEFCGTLIGNIISYSMLNMLNTK